MDAFTSASVVYRQARGHGASPMPLAAGEVAQLRRRPSVTRLMIEFAAVAAFFLILAILIGGGRG